MPVRTQSSHLLSMSLPTRTRATNPRQGSGISDILCGASRPGRFTGVATIVCKLFNMAQPDVAVFGEKDFQQLQVIRLMANDLSLPVQVVGAPIQREGSGLAMSSRNGYLSSSQREQASLIYQQLCWVKQHLNNASQATSLCRQASQRFRMVLQSIILKSEMLRIQTCIERCH